MPCLFFFFGCRLFPDDGFVAEVDANAGGDTDGRADKDHAVTAAPGLCPVESDNKKAGKVLTLSRQDAVYLLIASLRASYSA